MRRRLIDFHRDPRAQVAAEIRRATPPGNPEWNGYANRPGRLG